MKKILRFALGLFLVLAIAGCKKEPQKLEITFENAEITVGDTVTLVVETDGAVEEIVWTTSNSEIATVADGVVQALKAGTVEIKATLGKLEKTITLTIKEIPVDLTEKYGSYISVNSDGKLRVLQFADLHYGDPKKPYHNGKEARTKAFIDYVVENGKPDLIVCSGDNILDTGVSGLEELIELMESFQVPWTFMFGNHDSESGTAIKSKSTLSNKLLNVDSEYLIYEENYIDTTSNRYGNFSIQVLNQEKTKLLGSIILLDTGVYDYNAAQYQAITQNQINWYNSEIDRLNTVYQEDGGEGVIPTVVFGHIQLPEYYTAYKKAVDNDGAEFIIRQELSGSDVEEVKNGGPLNNTGFFDAMKVKQSTKAYFCGHAHTNYFQVKMDGIILGFGPQTGFSNTFKNDDLARKTYLYELSNDFSFVTESYDEATLSSDVDEVTMKVDEFREVNITLSNITGEISYEIDNPEICSVSLVEGIYQIKGLTSGETTVIFCGPNSLNVKVKVSVKEEKVYVLYNANSELVSEYKSLYQAIDEMLVDGLGVGSYVTEKGNSEKVFELTSNAYNYMTREGTYHGFDNNSNVTNGKSQWWQTYVQDLGLYSQGAANLLNTDTSSSIYGQFVTRPHNWEVFNTDGSGGYWGSDASQKVDGTWAGWQASVYKAGVSVAQYVSWADDTAYGLNTLNGVYDLTSSEMAPSNNPNQPTRADIWFGTTYIQNGGFKPMIMGITFNAGTAEENKDLADGTRREWKAFYEDIVYPSGLTIQTQGTRVLGETIGYSTWNKTKGVWECNEVFDISFKTNFSESANFSIDLKVKSTSTEATFTRNYDAPVGETGMRWIYGINYTPETGATRKVADITNGGYFIGAAQVSLKGLKNEEVIKPDMGFMAGRVANGARQIGIYGSDVLECRNIDGKCYFDFRY